MDKCIVFVCVVFCYREGSAKKSSIKVQEWILYETPVNSDEICCFDDEPLHERSLMDLKEFRATKDLIKPALNTALSSSLPEYRSKEQEHCKEFKTSDKHLEHTEPLYPDWQCCK